MRDVQGTTHWRSNIKLDTERLDSWEKHSKITNVMLWESWNTQSWQFPGGSLWNGKFADVYRFLISSNRGMATRILADFSLIFCLFSVMALNRGVEKILNINLVWQSIWLNNSSIHDKVIWLPKSQYIFFKLLDIVLNIITQRKYVRLGDVQTDIASVWKLLTKHWKLKVPNMVLSITGGDVTDLTKKPRLHKNFREGLIKTAATTCKSPFVHIFFFVGFCTRLWQKSENNEWMNGYITSSWAAAWIITEGLYAGSSREIGDIFQEDLEKTEWGEENLDLPLIAFTPWGILADRKPLYGIWVRCNNQIYLSVQNYLVEENCLMIRVTYAGW